MIVRDGITRTVLLIGRYAVKVPCLRYSGQRWKGFLRGLMANMQERMLGELQWPELCPVVFAVPGGFLLVMRRARMMTGAEWSTFRVGFYDFITKPDGAVIPVEDKPDSFGWLDGRVVAVDYGGFE